MTLQITGKNLDIGPTYRSYVQDKIEQRLEKFLGETIEASNIEGHIRLEKQGQQFRTNCSLKTQSGLHLQAHGESQDAYASADIAIDRLEKRLRRYKRRLKEHHNHTTPPTPFAEATNYVVNPSDNEHSESVDENPMIIAETRQALHLSTVSDAVMQLDLPDNTILLFKNAGHGRLNVVYRRPDGNIGWIDPETD